MSAIALRLAAVFAPLSTLLGGYAQLGLAAVGEYRAALMRRLVWAVVAVVFGLAGLAAAWMIGLAVFWDTPHRLTYVISSAVALLLVAGIAAVLALKSPRPGNASGLLREEFNKDRELFAQWTRTL